MLISAGSAADLRSYKAITKVNNDYIVDRNMINSNIVYHTTNGTCILSKFI